MQDYCFFQDFKNRMLNKITISKIFLIFLIVPFHLFSADLQLFPPKDRPLTLESMEYIQMLHTGIQSDTFYMRGKFGVDFPFATLKWNTDQLSVGITASAYLNMIPKNMKFAVDNFYAVLGIYFSGRSHLGFSWRLYPVYHLSAHLADGYRSDILKKDVRAVSSEMVRGELYGRPFRDLEVGLGYGYYYHTCAQQHLRQRGDISFFYTPDLFDLFQPFLQVKCELVQQKEMHPGVDASVGTFLLKKGRGVGFSLRFFNRLHSSYYFEEYEKGWGVEYLFVF